MIAFTACTAKSQKRTTKPAIQSIIFETDMGNDVDDALALDMLYKYIENNKINVLSIMSNKNSVYSAQYLDIMNVFYGHPKIPIGIMNNGPNSENDAVNYAKAVSLMQLNGKPMFKTSIKDYQALPEAHYLYRKILAQQPDSSVTIISVGFSTNLVRLLDTKPDKYSPLSGKELVAKKVKLLSAMLGSFQKEPFKEYNVIVDIPAAQKLFREWPSQIVASPFEVGNAILYPASSIVNDFKWISHHPMIEAYKVYLPMPYDRPTWDLTSLLYVADPKNSKMSVSEAGTISITNEGYSVFSKTANGKHKYLSVTAKQADELKNYFIKIITSKPKKYQKQ